MTIAQLKDSLPPRYADPAAVVQAFAAAYPTQKPVALAAIIGAAPWHGGAMSRRYPTDKALVYRSGP